MAYVKSTFRVFVSSTFDDLKEERNALQKQVFPKLRDLCLQNNCRFHAIDLRWGVSEEASLDQQTMKICFEEIVRCQRVTPRPNFIVLLGDRYGWCPLPEKISVADFNIILQTATPPNDIDLLLEWYWLDNNAVPPVYDLQPRRRRYLESENWQIVEWRLHSILVKAASHMNLSGQEKSKYWASATEQEILKGALETKDTLGNAFCFFRSMFCHQEGGTLSIRKNDGSFFPINKSLLGQRFKNFVDVDPQGNFDQKAHERLIKLKRNLSHKLYENVHNYNVKWTGNSVTTDHIGSLPDDLDACVALIDDDSVTSTLCVDVWKRLSQTILNEINQLEIIDDLDAEIDEHKKFSQKKRSVSEVNHDGIFVGREHSLREIDKHIKSHSSQPLIIHGESGTGKSTLMAEAVVRVCKNNPNIVVVQRFIGATPDSSNVRSLLEGLCRELDSHYEEHSKPLPADYKELIEVFAKRLALATKDKQLAIFIDALDQITKDDESKNLAWIPLELPVHAHMVISILTSKGLSSIQRRVPRAEYRKLLRLSLSEGSQLLQYWLDDAGRTLQDTQREEVLKMYDQCGLPLYLKIAFEEVKQWKSYTTEKKLNPEIRTIIGDLIYRLWSERNHGKNLIYRSLMYIAVSKNGLSEDEMLDVLSMDIDVFNEFVERSKHTPPMKRIPTVIWSRLYFELESYLTERSADGTTLINFYHGLFEEVIRDVAPKALQHIDMAREHHELLSRYFERQSFTSGTVTAMKPNIRKITEQPYQQIHGKRWKKLIETLTDLEFITLKSAGALYHALLTDYHEARLHHPEKKPIWQELEFWLAPRLPKFSTQPQTIKSELFNEFMNSVLDNELKCRLAGQFKGNTPVIVRIDQESGKTFLKYPHASGGGYYGDVGVHLIEVARNVPIAATAGRDGTISLWNITNAEIIRRFKIRETPIGMAISDDGMRVAVRCQGFLKLLYTETAIVDSCPLPKLSQTSRIDIIKLSERVPLLQLSFDGSCICIWLSHTQIAIIDYETAEFRHLIEATPGDKNRFSAYSLAHKSSILYVGTEGGKGLYYNLDQNLRPKEILEEEGRINSISCSACGATSVWAVEKKVLFQPIDEKKERAYFLSRNKGDYPKEDETDVERYLESRRKISVIHARRFPACELLMIRNDSLSIIATLKGSHKLVMDEHGDSVLAYYSSRNRRARLFDIKGNNSSKRADLNGEVVTMSPDGSAVLFSNGTGAIECIRKPYFQPLTVSKFPFDDSPQERAVCLLGVGSGLKHAAWRVYVESTLFFWCENMNQPMQVQIGKPQYRDRRLSRNGKVKAEHPCRGINKKMIFVQHIEPKSHNGYIKTIIDNVDEPEGLYDFELSDKGGMCFSRSWYNNDWIIFRLKWTGPPEEILRIKVNIFDDYSLTCYPEQACFSDDERSLWAIALKRPTFETVLVHWNLDACDNAPKIIPLKYDIEPESRLVARAGILAGLVHSKKYEYALFTVNLNSTNEPLFFTSAMSGKGKHISLVHSGHSSVDISLYGKFIAACFIGKEDICERETIQFLEIVDLFERKHFSTEVKGWQLKGRIAISDCGYYIAALAESAFVVWFVDYTIKRVLEVGSVWIDAPVDITFYNEDTLAVLNAYGDLYHYKVNLSKSREFVSLHI